jgi:hypothetical protein
MLKTRLLWISSKSVQLGFIKSCRVNKSSYENQLRIYEFTEKCAIYKNLFVHFLT